MAITLPDLTGNKEIAANAGYAKVQLIIAEILALDTQVNGHEDPELRAEHDRIVGYNVQFLFECLKVGFMQWLSDLVYRKGVLLRNVDTQEAQTDSQVTEADVQNENSEVEGIVGGLG